MTHWHNDVIQISFDSWKPAWLTSLESIPWSLETLDWPNEIKKAIKCLSQKAELLDPTCPQLSSALAAVELYSLGVVRRWWGSETASTIGSASPAATAIIYWIPPPSLVQTPGSSVNRGTPGLSFTPVGFLLHIHFLSFKNIMDPLQLIINFSGKIWKLRMEAGPVYCLEASQRKN